MNSCLLTLLARDSVKVAELEGIYARYCESQRFGADAIWVMRQLDSDRAWRAVWLLKRLARERKLTEAELIGIASCVEEMRHWASRLDLCQMLAATGWPTSADEPIYSFLVECFADRRVIIRAWAISALVRLGDHPKYKGHVAAMLRDARADAGKAMKARLRQLKTHSKSSKP